MQTDVGYIQPKDYMPKPEPFYHIPVPVMVGDTYKLSWQEDEGLKARFYKKAKKEAFKQQVYKFFMSQDEYLKLLLEPVSKGLEKAFDEDDEETVLKILKSPFLPEDIKPIAEDLLNQYIKEKGERENG